MGKQEKAEKKRIDIKSLADLRPRMIDAEIEVGDEVLVIPCRALTYQEQMEAGWEVSDPVPPIMGVGDDKRPLYDYQDPGYLKQKERANTERMYRRLLRFVQLEIPGETVEERVKALQDTLEYSIVTKLTMLMMRTFTEGEARANSRADSF
jgi:hypothetical protein